MNTETSSTEAQGNLHKPNVMPRLTPEQIESIEMMQIGEMCPKKLKRVVVNHPAQNIYGLVRINDEYYMWCPTNGA